MIPENIRCGATEFFFILGHFLLFDPPNNPKNQNFEKRFKKPGDVIFLNLCTTNDNHVIRDSSDMGLAERIFCHFELFFALLPS